MTITWACVSSSVISYPLLLSIPSISSESTRFLSQPREIKSNFIDISPVMIWVLNATRRLVARSAFMWRENQNETFCFPVT